MTACEYYGSILQQTLAQAGAGHDKTNTIGYYRDEKAPTKDEA